ncbi:MAG: 3-deoxy-D-manno-octulosonic-acid transferase [Cryomorphaceae bacterium]|jgi:3-deoxy-D-manno-octulosonic-acid transferase
MGKFFVLTVYNILLPVFFIMAFPAWLLKMAKRGGIGSGLLERFGLFKEDELLEEQGVIYIHAVSVGEVLVAIKLINEWLLQHPLERILLVPTTATGHAVAKEHAPQGVRVIYSPLDFGFILRRVFRRFAPKQIILMESEIWPNMLHVAQKLSIPVNIANARLSPRSEKRYLKLGFILRPLLEMLGKLCAQDSGDKSRWESVGVPAERITVTGSVKFDQSGAGKPQQRAEFGQMLDGVSGGKKIIVAISTHAGEEAWIAAGLKDLADEICLVIVPRHAERRAEVVSDIESEGYDVVLRSDYEAKPGACFVIDSTGELRDWTAHADVVIVGKSILGKGGQNPTEAMSVSVPVLTGGDMRNFEPLVTQLREAGGIRMFSNEQEMLDSVRELLDGDSLTGAAQAQAALKVLETHQGASSRTVEALWS